MRRWRSGRAAPEHLFILTESGRVWLSDSGGLAWRCAPRSRAVTALAIAPISASGLGRDDRGPGIQREQRRILEPGTAAGRSVDYGAGKRRASGNPLCRRDRAARCIAATTAATWTTLARPGPRRKVRALVLDAGSRELLYAATDDGVWVRSDAAARRQRRRRGIRRPSRRRRRPRRLPRPADCDSDGNAHTVPHRHPHSHRNGDGDADGHR